MVKLVEGLHICEVMAISCLCDDKVFSYLTCALRRLLIYHRICGGDLVRSRVKLLRDWSSTNVQKTCKPSAIVLTQSRAPLCFISSCEWICKNHTGQATHILQNGLLGYGWHGFCIEWLGGWWTSFVEFCFPDLLWLSSMLLQVTRFQIGGVPFLSIYKLEAITSPWLVILDLQVTSFGGHCVHVRWGDFGITDFTWRRATLIPNAHNFSGRYCLWITAAGIRKTLVCFTFTGWLLEILDRKA